MGKIETLTDAIAALDRGDYIFTSYISPITPQYEGELQRIAWRLIKAMNDDPFIDTGSEQIESYVRELIADDDELRDMWIKQDVPHEMWNYPARMALHMRKNGYLKSIGEVPLKSCCAVNGDWSVLPTVPAA